MHKFIIIIGKLMDDIADNIFIAFNLANRRDLGGGADNKAAFKARKLARHDVALIDGNAALFRQSDDSFIGNTVEQNIIGRRMQFTVFDKETATDRWIVLPDADTPIFSLPRHENGRT